MLLTLDLSLHLCWWNGVYSCRPHGSMGDMLFSVKWLMATTLWKQLRAKKPTEWMLPRRNVSSLTAASCRFRRGTFRSLRHFNFSYSEPAPADVLSRSWGWDEEMVSLLVSIFFCAHYTARIDFVTFWDPSRCSNQKFERLAVFWCYWNFLVILRDSKFKKV